MQIEANKAELIRLVLQIMDTSQSDEDRAVWLEALNKLVPHPTVADLIFWPQEHGLGNNPTPEDIVDAALGYKPIQL